jgi:SAM-dependent methyltransferase
MEAESSDVLVNTDVIATPIEVTEDQQETIGWLRRFIDLFWITFLNLLPENFGHNAFKKTSKDGTEVTKAATTYKALEIFYKWDGKFHFDKGVFDGLFTYAWQCIHNVQAVRNRKKIAAQILVRTNPDMLISLGSGSARMVLEYLNHHFVPAYLIDYSQDAINYSKMLAASDEFRLSSRRNIAWHKDVAQNFGKYLPAGYQGKVLFEMVGLLDYFDDFKTVNFFSQMSSALKPGDVFCVSNIIPNAERPFVEKVIRWKDMHYRTPEHLKGLLLAGGFKKNEIKVTTDATNIYSIAEIKKE